MASRWPHEARFAAIEAIDARCGPELQITVPMTMNLATDILNAVAPLIRADERERIRQVAIRNQAVCPGEEGTSCFFSDLIRELP